MAAAYKAAQKLGTVLLNFSLCLFWKWLISCHNIDAVFYHYVIVQISFD